MTDYVREDSNLRSHTRVRHLHLTPEMYTSSRELRAWCTQNRNRVYIPEWLLKEWGITVDPNFSGAA